ncbi:MAG: chloramphenicol phosphotransferase [Devosia sp.]|nr:chloramphenicol phosphotransferase [Devosia sp.]
MSAAGQIIILNGAPRSGKSSIARAIQQEFEGAWINLGVDASMAMTPERYRPGIGLRPGGERPDLEPVVQKLYAGLFESIAAHARLELNVVADLGMHDAYSAPLGIFGDMQARLAGLPVLLVGVLCPLDTIMARRNADPRGGFYAAGDTVPDPVRRWQDEVHRGMAYDLTLDTSRWNPAQCATTIQHHLGK